MKLLINLFVFFMSIASYAQLANNHERPIEKDRLVELKFADNCGVEIRGKTNVNSFECECVDQKPFKHKTFSGIVNTGKINFIDANLLVPISSISCGNRLMNSDLHELLESEIYPNIEIEFIDATWDVMALWQETPEEEKSIGHFDVNITIAGVERKQKVHIFRTEVDQTKFLFATSGEIFMNLRDFNLEPPVKFMGMVKVAEEIHLELDLNFHWAENTVSN